MPFLIHLPILKCVTYSSYKKLLHPYVQMCGLMNWVTNMTYCHYNSQRTYNIQCHGTRRIVSLPRWWIQEIKRMKLVHLSHGLFLTWTQNLIILQIIHCSFYTSDNAWFNPTLCPLFSPVYLLGEPAPLLVVQIPMHSCPWSANNCPTLS